MIKEKEIKVRVSENDYEKIKKSAKHKGMTVSGYVRSRLEENIEKDWIEKTTVQKSLSEIKFILGKAEEKNRRLADTIGREVQKLWEKL